MFGFFYNILATFSGGRKFEQLQGSHIRKVRKILKGAKLSSVDTQVFAQMYQRQKGESFFAYVKRKNKLKSLNDEGRQILIHSEKKRLRKVQKNKDDMLQKYLSGNLSSQNEVQESVYNTLNQRLSPSDADVFRSLVERQENESMFAHLKRSQQLYRLPIEEKQKLVQAEKKRASDEQFRRNDLLEQYLTETPTEQEHNLRDMHVRQVENLLSQKNSKGLKR